MKVYQMFPEKGWSKNSYICSNEEPCKIRHQSAALNTSVHNNVHSYAYALK